MCGIYGIAKSPTPYTEGQLNIVKKVLREIAIDSETRGSHSSGIARVGSSTRIHSQLIFKAINDNDNIQDAIKNFDSDFALSFVKTNPMILYLCRESNRPLHVAYIPSLKTLFYASESDFLEDALIMNNIEPDVFSLNKNTLYIFDVTKFTDQKINVSKELFEYDSRVYHTRINKYPSFTSYDEEWTQEIPQEMLDDESLHLSQVYGGRPEEWFWDETQQGWFFLDNVSGEIKSEEVISNEQYYQDNEQEMYEETLRTIR